MIQSLKAKLIALAVAIGLILIAIFQFGLGKTPIPVVNNETQTNPSDPSVISSDPKELYIKEPLVVSPNQVLTINFNVPLLNGPETKITLEPKHDIEVKLSDDYKSAIITPKTPYKLGQGYTVFISREAKLRDEGKTLGKEYDFHFNVINYSGI